jgi:hypothetical protein
MFDCDGSNEFVDLDNEKNIFMEGLEDPNLIKHMNNARMRYYGNRTTENTFQQRFPPRVITPEHNIDQCREREREHISSEVRSMTDGDDALIAIYKALADIDSAILELATLSNTLHKALINNNSDILLLKKIASEATSLIARPANS